MSLTKTQSSLLLLGLTEAQLSTKPTASSFPPKYNPRSLPLWVKMFDDLKVMTVLSRKDVAQSWDWVIPFFNKYCKAKNVETIVGNNPVNYYDRLSSRLSHTRNVLVRYAIRAKILEQFPLKVSSTETLVQVTPKELTIFVRASSSGAKELATDEITDYLQRMPYPRLTLSSNRIYYRDLIPGSLRFWVQYLNNLRIFLGYKISVPWEAGSQLPHNKAANQLEVETWVKKEFWPSIVVVCRLRGARFEPF